MQIRWNITFKRHSGKCHTLPKEALLMLMFVNFNILAAFFFFSWKTPPHDCCCYILGNGELFIKGLLVSLLSNPINWPSLGCVGEGVSVWFSTLGRFTNARRHSTNKPPHSRAARSGALPGAAIDRSRRTGSYLHDCEAVNPNIYGLRDAQTKDNK